MMVCVLSGGYVRVVVNVLVLPQLCVYVCKCMGVWLWVWAEERGVIIMV